MAFGFSEKVLTEDDVMISDSIYNLLEPKDENVVLEFDTSQITSFLTKGVESEG